ncbi:cupin domain-containing protein [Pantoea ananatis]
MLSFTSRPPFRLATDLTRKPVDFQTVRTRNDFKCHIASKTHETSGCFLVGGHFLLAGRAARLLLHSLSPVVHVHRDADKKAMYWAL